MELGLFLAVVTFSIFALMSIPWAVHISMVKDQEVEYGWAGYKEFKREFVKYRWNIEGWEEGLYSRECYSKCHASIILFGGKGMIMVTPIDYYLVTRHIKHYKRNEKKKLNVIKW